MRRPQAQARHTGVPHRLPIAVSAIQPVVLLQQNRFGMKLRPARIKMPHCTFQLTPTPSSGHGQLRLN
jgi:hypothetical protein